MKSNFKDPIAPRKREPRAEPKNGKTPGWDFRAPEYDERDSEFIHAGTNYGVGFRNPVGHEGKPKEYAEVMPMTNRTPNANPYE
jgi:hypothetical protein